MKYQLGAVIGEGSHAVVREAVHAETLRRVAVKIVKKTSTTTFMLRGRRNVEQQLRKEIAIIRRLRHRNVLSFVESVRDEETGNMCIVTELVNGGSLQERIARSQPMSLENIKDLFRQLIDGIEYIHSQGVIHRDIKPDNLLLTSDGVLKIADFGVADTIDCFCPEDTVTRTVGSPAFHSPQIATGQDAFSGEKCDVWSAGVTLYYMVTGQLPFEGLNLIDLYDHIRSGSLSPLSTIVSLSPELQSLLTGMLCVDESRRLTIEQIRRHPWMMTTRCCECSTNQEEQHDGKDSSSCSMM